MDAQTFDRWTAALAHRPTRRVALRLLAGSLAAGLLSLRGAALGRAAQRSDRDGDGLFDDDEVEVYGTDPDIDDTDGDGSGDGDEVYYGTDPLAADGGAVTANLTGDAGEVTGDGGDLGPANDVEPGSQDLCSQVGQSCATATCCIGFCNQDELCECTGDTGFCQTNQDCCNGVCNANNFCGACGSLGATCNSAADCCKGDYAVECCFDGVSLTTRCTDVTNIGFVCPGEPVGPVTCAAGLTDCGGQCFNLAIAQFNCGACGYSCGLAGGCRGGVCTPLTADATDPGMVEPTEPYEPEEPAVSDEEREEILSGGGGGGGGGGSAGGGGGPCEIEGACGDPVIVHEDERNTNTHPQG